MKILTAQTAQISTAAVSINTLTVSGKQVTLAVFRQVIVEPIIDRDACTVRGPGWGHVNYLVQEGCRHLLWQSGTELRRCYITRKDYESEPWHNAYKFTKEWLQSEPKKYAFLSEGRRWSFLNAPKEWYYSKESYDRLALLAQLEREYVCDCKYHAMLNALLVPLYDLPQLFIAV